MHFVKSNEGKEYEAAKHFKYWSARKIDGKRLSVGISHFLPGGGAELSSSPKERVYYQLSGMTQIKGETDEFLLEPGDLIYIEPNEKRQFITIGSDPSTILVMINDLS